jgi:hypothetical protein
MTTVPTTPDPEATPCPRWEYHVLEVGQPMEGEELQSLGDQGWKLCIALKYGVMITYNFVRPSRSPPS